jgi:hypothetical protein
MTYAAIVKEELVMSTFKWFGRKLLVDGLI